MYSFTFLGQEGAHQVGSLPCSPSKFPLLAVFQIITMIRNSVEHDFYPFRTSCTSLAWWEEHAQIVLLKKAIL